MPKQYKYMLCGLIALSLMAAGWTLAVRVGAENANRVVAIGVDYNRVQELAIMRGVSIVAALRRLKSAGATHIVVREESLGDLLQEERVTLQPRGRGVLVTAIPAIAERVYSQLAQRAPGGKRVAEGMEYPDAVAFDLLRPVGMGYPATAAEDARAAGLLVATRPIAEMTLTQEALGASMDAVQEVGGEVVIFSGLSVWGMYDLVPWVADEMQRRGIQFGYVEMAKQFGDAKLAGELKGRIIRCHAIVSAEMPKLHPRRALERYSLAVRERNVRFCYVRLYDHSAPDPLEAGVQLVAQIAQDLASAGFRMGRPEPFRAVHVSPVALAGMLVGVGAGLIWLIQLLFGLPPGLFWRLVVADVVLSGGAAAAAFGLAQAAGALGAAIIFPTLALCSVQLRDPGGRASFWTGVRLTLAVSLVSLLGGLLVAGCQSDIGHMMQIGMFRGVKLAQVIPLLLVLVVFAGRCTPTYWAVRTERGPHLPEWPALRAGIIEAAGLVVRYWHLAVLIVGVGMAALMLVRSGNVTPVPPSDLELAVRSFLDKTLAVRPRTKEILLGHPALVLTLALLAAGWRRGLWLGMLLGAVGQVSLVNTFGHVHTPLWVSLLRVANGLWVGILVAGVLVLLRALVLRFISCPVLDTEGRLRAP